MRAVVQRVSRAEVTVDGELIGRIDRGFLVLLGVAVSDLREDVVATATKIVGLRVFEDEARQDEPLARRCRRSCARRQPVHPAGRLSHRPPPSFVAAAPPELAQALSAASSC